MAFIVSNGGNGVAKPLTPVKTPAASNVSGAKPTAGPLATSTKAQGLGVLPGMPGSAQVTEPGANTGGSGAQPSLDATALANIAAYLNKTGSTIASDNTGVTNYQTQLANTLAEDKQANQLANLKMMTGANAGGGLYGSAYGQQLANQNTAYGEKESDATSTANTNIAKLQNAIAELQASEPIEASQEAAASASRAATLAAQNAPASLTPTAPSTPTASTSTLAQKVAQAQGRANNKQLKQTGTPKGGLR